MEEASSSARSSRTTASAARSPTNRGRSSSRSTTASRPRAASRPPSTTRSRSRDPSATPPLPTASTPAASSAPSEGDSAGGGQPLSALRHQAGACACGTSPPLAFQLLVYPATDFTRAMPSHGRVLPARASSSSRSASDDGLVPRERSARGPEAAIQDSARVVPLREGRHRAAAGVRADHGRASTRCATR